MNTYPNPSPIARTTTPPSATPPIIRRHWLRSDNPISFAEQAAASEFGGRWAKPSSRDFVDRPPPRIIAPKPAPDVHNPVSAILSRKRRAA